MAGALIGALRVSLSAETSAFEAGMKRAQRSANQTAGYIRTRFGNVGASLKSSLAGLAAGLTAGAVFAAGKAALEYAGHLGELASTLGLTTKDLQAFSYAAGQVGISQDELESGIQKLTISMGKAQVGSAAQVKAFNAIGISIDQLKGKDAGEVFRLIAEKLQGVEDRSKRAAVEVALFGKAGAKLDNLLSGSQGRLGDLAEAAERLGIVLSDEQIQKADETADRIEALQTVLKARIAGVVADNADSILEMANALGELAGQLARALGELSRFASAVDKFGGPIKDFFASISNPDNSLPVLLGLQKRSGGGSSSVTVKLPAATKKGTVPLHTNVGQFLAPSRGGGRGRKERDTSLRDAFQFDQDIRRAQQDIRRAQQNLAANYIERTTIGIEILNAEKEAFEAELVYKVKAKELTQAQADQLLAAFNKKDALERQALLEEEQAQKAEDIQQLTQHDFDRRRDTLEAAANIAETAEERRQIELELLQIAYEQKRQALQNIIDTSKDIAAIEDARRDLLNLNSTYGSDRQSVINSTRGPMEDWLASLPTTAAKANEALQMLEVQGFNGLIDSVLALSEGVGAATDSLLDTLKNFFLGLARMELQKLLGGAISGGGLGGLIPGFASGGSFMVGGNHGIDRNVLSLNGLPIARVSYRERISIGNDNGRTQAMGGGVGVYMTVNTPDADSFRRSAGQTVRQLKRKLA